MSWNPSDLVTDADLVAYEANILTQFGKTEWLARRTKALEDWLFPLLEARKFDPTRLRTRHAPAQVFHLTGATYTDKTTNAASVDGLNLATLLAATSDALFIGFARPFRGALFQLLEGVNSTVDGSFSVAAWTGAWSAVEGLTDSTKIGTKHAARGGSLVWGPKTDPMIRRAVNGSDSLYWMKVTASAAPTGATAGPITVIQRSRLCAAVTFRTLELIFAEAPLGQDGPWEAKRQQYHDEAEVAFTRVVEAIGPEFDTDNDDQIDGDEETQTAAEASGGGWSLERA